MTEKTLAEEIITIIKKESTNTPPPEQSQVIETHPDNTVTIENNDGTILRYVPLIGTAEKNDTVLLFYLTDDYTQQIAIGINLTHDHPWKIVKTGDLPEKYTLYVNEQTRTAEIVIVYKPTTDKTGTTKTGINVGDYKPLGISIRRSNKTGIDIGVATTGDIYIYGTVPANTNVQGSLLWHY